MDVRTLRKAARLTQLELALKCPVSRMRLSLAECGHISLRDDELARIERVLLQEVNGRVLRVNAALSNQPTDLGIGEPAGARGEEELC